MKAVICEIEKFAIHDGPGIRTLIFFKGCPLRCTWCSNPETQHHAIQISFNSAHCVNCKKCLEVCENMAILHDNDEIVGVSHSNCIRCGKCISSCNHGALNKLGYEIEANELFKEIMKDSTYFQVSGGGVTLSGGEVLSQHVFAKELLQKCRENYIHTAIETSGYGSFESLKSLTCCTNLIMYDIKHTNSRIHEKFTGKGNELILENLSKISKLHNNIIIRIPLINNFNDDFENIENTCRIAEENRISEIHILPYHEFGKGKYKQLAVEYKMNDSSKCSLGKINEIKSKIELHKIKCVIGG